MYPEELTDIQHYPEWNEKDIFHSKHHIAKVVLKKVPSYARVQRIEPDNIEYLIRKK